MILYVSYWPRDPCTAIMLYSPAFLRACLFLLCLWCFQGFTMLMDANRINDLSRMYNLFQRVNAVELLKLALSAYIRATGQGIIMDEEKDKELVPFLLEFKASLDKILEESFAKNEAFSNTIKDSFEHLINLRQV
jgi:cullin 4